MKTSIRKLDSLTHNDTAATKLINDNFSALQQGIEDSLSRTGKTPNFMDAPLDMNMNRIINVGTPEEGDDLATKEYVDNTVASEAEERKAADRTLQNNINSVALGLTGVANGLNNEISRAKSVEGTLSNLNTTNKNNLVGAINEIKGEADSKQDELISGTNIKTINGESVLGSGDIVIEAENGDTYVERNILATWVHDTDTENKPCITFSKTYTDDAILDYVPTVYFPCGWSLIGYHKMDAFKFNKTLKVYVYDYPADETLPNPCHINILWVKAATTGNSDQLGFTNEGFRELEKSKQDTLTEQQLNAVNSGITSGKVSQYDGYSSSKQDTLVSGTSIKTINNESILGSGNIEIQGGGSLETKYIAPVTVSITTLGSGKKRAVIDLSSYFDNDDNNHYLYYVAIPYAQYLESVTSYKVTVADKRKVQLTFSEDFSFLEIVVSVIAVPLGEDTTATGYESRQPVFIIDKSKSGGSAYMDWEKIKQELENKMPSSTKYAADSSLSINSSTFVVTLQLKDQDGNNIGSAQTIDLPLESVVVNGSYDSTNKKIVLTLENGNTIDVPVADLVSGLQTEITSNNKLSADLVDDTSTTNKFVTSGEKSAIGTAVQPSSLATVATSGLYSDLSGQPTIPVNTSDLNNDSGFITSSYLIDYVTTNTAQVISNRKTFLGEKAIYFKQSAATDKLGFTLFDNVDAELAAFEFRPNTIGGNPLLNINASQSGNIWLGFRYWANINIVAPKPSNGTYYIPVKITDGTNTATANNAGTVDISSLIPSTAGFEQTSNKVTSLSSASTDTQYPSAKCVYDIVGDIETLINAL